MQIVQTTQRFHGPSVVLGYCCGRARRCSTTGAVVDAAEIVVWRWAAFEGFFRRYFRDFSDSSSQI